MTKEHRDKIQSESIHAVENLFSGRPTYPESYCELYEKGAAFGYNLALAPAARNPDDEKAAEAWVSLMTGKGYRGEDAFLAGCTHKAQTMYRRKDHSDTEGKEGAGC